MGQSPSCEGLHVLPALVCLCADCSLSLKSHRLSVFPVDVDHDLDRESQEYLEALAQVTGELEYCINLCKSRVMMETCFDITVTTACAATQGGQQEVDV